jgi:hypothetical protein
MGANDISDRVGIDLERYLKAQELAERFPVDLDETNIVHVRQVAGATLAPAIQRLLEKRLCLTEGDYLKDDLDALLLACREAFNDL